MQERAILDPTHDVVDMINEYMLSLVLGEAKMYLCSDSTCKTDTNVDTPDDVHTPKFLNSIKCFGLPTYCLKLKCGVPIMLLWNIDQPSGLCNGTKLMITQLGTHVVEAKIISDSNIG